MVIYHGRIREQKSPTKQTKVKIFTPRIPLSPMLLGEIGDPFLGVYVAEGFCGEKNASEGFLSLHPYCLPNTF